MTVDERKKIGDIMREWVREVEKEGRKANREEEKNKKGGCDSVPQDGPQ